jgi:hypothetical protein
MLKNGTLPLDPRLGRIPNWDRHNLEYPIRKIIKPEAKLRSYTWGFANTVVLDQRTDGACVGFGYAHELMCRPRVVNGVTDEYAKGAYWEIQKIDAWPGGAYPNAEPFYEGTSVLDGARWMKVQRWYDEYRWALNVDDLAMAVGHHGPAVIGVNWYTSMFEPDQRGLITIRADAEVAGGHCVLLRGVHIIDAAKGKYMFRIRNSWGTSWGIFGDAWISSDDMRKLHAEQGEFCIPVVRLPRTRI